MASAMAPETVHLLPYSHFTTHKNLKNQRERNKETGIACHIIVALSIGLFWVGDKMLLPFLFPPPPSFSL
jgi:hypothetical protein